MSNRSSLSDCLARIRMVGLAGLLILTGCGQSGEPSATSSPTRSGVAVMVELSVDFSGQDDLAVSVPCSANSTVFDILVRAQNMSDLKFEHRGSGETVFVSSIGGIENQGAAGDNWVYRVNGKLGDRSCGICPVQPRDRIEWKFGDYPKQ